MKSLLIKKFLIKRYGLDYPAFILFTLTILSSLLIGKILILLGVESPFYRTLATFPLTYTIFTLMVRFWTYNVVPTWRSSFKPFMAIILLALTFFHVIDFDGPCDYEEENGSHSSCILKSCKIPAQEAPTVSNHNHIPDHIGHSPVIFSSWKKPEINYYILGKFHYHIADQNFSFFNSEIFRPPVS